MSNIGPTLITIVASIIGLAMVAVVVSSKAQTPQVLTGAGSMLSSIIGAAVAPVTSGGNMFGSSSNNVAGVAK